jgi:hypothetical protein
MLAQSVMFWTCTWEVPGANTGQETNHCDTVDCGFPQSLQTNVHAVPLNPFQLSSNKLSYWLTLLHKPKWHTSQPEHSGAQPKAEALPPSWDPSIHSSTSAFTALGHARIPDQPHVNIWFEPLLPLTLVKELDCELLVVSYSKSLSAEWVHAPHPNIF